MRHLAIALIVIVCGATSARADESQGSHAVEGEGGLVVVYSTSDLLSIGGFVGFSLGKPILDVFYVEPVLQAEFSLFNAGRLTGMLRCNFVMSVGVVASIGVGAGTGWKSYTDDNFDTHQLERDHRVIEVAVKKGGKRRFLVGLAMALDTDEMGVESKSFMLQTTFVKAGP